MTDPTSAEKEREYSNLLGADPGNEAFIEYGEYLRQAGRLPEALFVVARGVSASPDHGRGRLLLARVFFDSGCTALAGRELEVLVTRYPDGKFLRKLYERLIPEARRESQQPPVSSKQAAETVAEADIDLDALD